MKVLIVVDMQADFITGPLATPEAQAVVPLVAETIEQMADPNTVVIFTRDTHQVDYMDTLEGKNLPVAHCIAGTAGHNIVTPVLDAYLDNKFKYKGPFGAYPLAEHNPIVINKPSFGSIELQNMLYAMDDVEKIEEITLMGVCTGICVLSNAILAKATLPEVPVNVVADCCACVTPESHKTALEAMKLCQINII